MIMSSVHRYFYISQIEILVCSMIKCLKSLIYAYCHATIPQFGPAPTDRSRPRLSTPD